jgi:hypothetical protein
LNDLVGHVEFARHLYNLLCVELDRDQDRDTKLAIAELHRRIEDPRLKSMHTQDLKDMTGITGRN